MNRIRGWMENNRGQAVVEFALVLPILMLLVAGMLDFGLIMNQYLTLTSAAREGARSVALGANDVTAITAVKNAVGTLNKGTMVITVSPAVRKPGDSITVAVSNPIQTVTPMIGAYFGTNYSVKTQSVMRME